MATTRRVFLQSMTVLGAAQLAGCDTGTPTDDRRTTSDSGTPINDGGAPTSDSGTPLNDGGAPTDDGGAPTDDGGTSADDGGTSADDGGTSAEDGGAATDDGGTIVVAGITSPSADEGSALTFLVTLSGTTNGPLRLTYSVGGSAGASDIGAAVLDAGISLVGGELTVPAGVSGFAVTFSTAADAEVEGSETVVLTIGGVSGTGTIAERVESAWVDLAGPEPSDWLRAKMDGTDRYILAASFQPYSRPWHGEELLTANPLLAASTSQAFSAASLDAQAFAFQVKAWLSDDATAVQVVSAPGVNMIPAWPTPLASGDYGWRMEDPVAGWTAWRFFRVLAGATTETVTAMASALAAVTAKASPRFRPADLSGYDVGGPQRSAYDAMVARVAGVGAVPVEPNWLVELPHVADLCHLYWITNNTTYRNALIDRLVGNGTTTGLAHWAWTTVDEAQFRFGLIALALAYDSTKSTLSAPQRAAAVAALATAVERAVYHQDSRFTSSTAWTQGGRWPGQQSLFGGHAHNHWICASVAAAALAGDEVTYAGTAGIETTVPLLLRWLPVTLRVMDPMLLDDGSYAEGKGYAGHSTDFQAALCAAGWALGYDWARSPRSKAFARTMNRAYPFSHAFHGGPGGDDDSVAWDPRGVVAARRSGEPDYSLQRAIGTITEARMSGNKAIDHHWLAPVAPEAGDTANIKALRTRQMSVFHTDVEDPERTSAWIKHQPDGMWNHAVNVLGGWTMVSRSQALFLHGHINDEAFQGQHSKAEVGQAATANGTVVFGADLTAAGNGTRGANHGRRTRSRLTYFERDAGGMVRLAQDLDEAADLCASIPTKTATGAWLADVAVKAEAKEQTITIRVTGVSGTGAALTCTVSGSSLEPIIGTATNHLDNPQFYAQVAGTVVVGDTFTFDILRSAKARAYHVWLPEGVLLAGAHYEFPSARPVGYRFYTRNVQVPSSIVVGAGGTLMVEFPGGTGLPAGQVVQIEVNGVSGGVTGAASLNGPWSGVVTGGGASISADVSAAGVGAGIPTGSPIRVNVGPSAAPALNSAVTVACRSRSAGPLASAQLIPVLTPTHRVLQDPSWFLGDAALPARTINHAADEHGGSPANSPIYHRWHNRFEYGSLSSLFSWLAVVAPAGVTVSGVTQVLSGTTPNRTAALRLTVNGTAYQVSIDEATGRIR